MKIEFNAYEKYYIDVINSGETESIDDNLKEGDLINVTFAVTDLARASAFLYALYRNSNTTIRNKHEWESLREESGVELVSIDTGDAS